MVVYIAGMCTGLTIGGIAGFVACGLMVARLLSGY